LKPFVKNRPNFVLVLVTAPDIKTARTLAKAILSVRLAACVNLLPRIESHYWWKGEIEVGAEVLMLIKTRKDRLKKLEKEIVARHPYDSPEFLVLPVADGNKRYLDWLSRSVS
jgi:periplasmic divalent cation tolerance protein